MQKLTEKEPISAVYLALFFAFFVALPCLTFQPKDAYFFEITLTSTKEGTAQIYYDIGRGFNEEDSTRRRLPVQAEPAVCRFSIPTGTYNALRFDPIDNDGIVTMADAKIVDRNEKIVREFSSAQFRPDHQIDRLIPEKNGLKAYLTPGGDDPFFRLLIDRSFRLKADFHLLSRALHSLPVFIIAFLGGLAAKISTNSPVQPWAKFSRLSPGLTVAACALVLFARMPDRFLNPQFWAEDGYFYEWALKFGGHVLFKPYGGYLLLVPRLTTWLAATLKFSLLHVPLFFNGVAFIAALLVIWKIFSRRIDLPCKPLLALAVVLTPRPEDIFMAMENIQWILSLAIVLLLISADAASRREHISDYLVAAICGLTGVFSIILLPLFLLRAYQRKTSHSIALAATIGAAALMQAWIVIHSPPLSVAAPIPFKAKYIPCVLGYRLFFYSFGGKWLPYIPHFALGLTGILMILFLAFVCTNPRAQRQERINRQYLLGAFLLFSAASIYRFKDMLTVFLTQEHLARYFFIPQVILIWLIITELPSSLPRRTIAVTLFLAFMVTGACFFSVEPLVDYHWGNFAHSIKPGESRVTPINPPGWFFQYPWRQE